MPLDGVQQALGLMVATNRVDIDDRSLDSLDLTVEERGWLRAVRSSKGLGVTSYVQRSWRELGVYQSAILTASALGQNHAREAIEAYLDSVHCQSLFVFAEAIAFLDFVVNQNSPLPHVDAIARFERALLRSAQSASLQPPNEMRDEPLLPDEQVMQNPAAAIVEFRATPESLLGALTAGQRLPPEGERMFPIIVAPRLDYLWRPATPDESAIFRQCLPKAMVASVLAAYPGSESVVSEMVRIAALLVAR